MAFSGSSSSSSSSSDGSPIAAAPKGFSFSLRPLISKLPPGAAKEPMGLAALKPPKPPPRDPPKELPPNPEVLELPSAPKPPLEDIEGAALPAKEDNLPALAPPNGELAFGLEAATPPNGDVDEAAKPLKPDPLNFSSDV